MNRKGVVSTKEVLVKQNDVELLGAVLELMDPNEIYTISIFEDSYIITFPRRQPLCDDQFSSEQWGRLQIGNFVPIQ